MLPLVSPWNYVRAMCAEIPYWWCVTTQIWVVLMISHATSLWLTIRKTTQFLVVTPHQYGISALIPQTSFCGKNQWWHHKMWAVFSGSSSWCFPRHLPFCVGKEEWETENEAWFLNQVLKSREHSCASYGSVCLTGGWTTANTGGNGTVIRTSCMLTRTETLQFHTVEALLSSRKSFCPMR